MRVYASNRIAGASVPPLPSAADLARWRREPGVPTTSGPRTVEQLDVSWGSYAGQGEGGLTAVMLRRAPQGADSWSTSDASSDAEPEVSMSGG